MPLKLTTYYHGKDIPELPGKNAFHSKELFQIYEATPGYTPLLIVATEDGRPVARLLAAIRKAKKWLPSSLVKHCVVYSEGEFLDESLSTNKEKAEEINFKQTLFRKLQRFSDENDGCKIDWNDHKQTKYSIYYNRRTREVAVTSCRYVVEPLKIYFFAEEIANKAIELFQDELIKYFTM